MLNAVATRLIPPPNNKQVLKNADGQTRDIIKEVLDCYQDSRDQLIKFAPNLQGQTLLETCCNIWKFWKANVRYQVDNDGEQWIKTPAKFWQSGFGDCKSYSVAVASSLHCLGIDGKFRFTSYDGKKDVPTHVYVVAKDGRKEIIIDCVWTGFNSQKPYTKKWDYNMTKVYRLSGTDSTDNYAPAKKYAVGELNIDANDHTTTEAEFAIALDLQRLELEQQIHRRRHGHAIGSIYDNQYQVEIEAHKAALGSIGLFKSKKKRLAKAVKMNNGKGVNKRQAKLLAKAGIAVKKKRDGLLKRIGKGITAIIKTPLRLAAKAALPKSAPFFLYLYITDPNILAKIPEAVKTKREKAIQYRAKVVDKLQMPGSNFDKIIRNGILAAFGDQPEAVIAKWMAQANWKVSGLLDTAMNIAQSAGGALKSLLGKFGEDLAADAEQFTPAPEDWGTLANAQNVSAQQQSYSQYAVQDHTNSGSSSTTTDDTGTGTDDIDNYPAGTTLKEPATGNTWTKMDSGSWQNDQTGRIETKIPLGVEKTLPDVTVTSGSKSSSSNNFLLIAGAAALLLTMKKK